METYLVNAASSQYIHQASAFLSWTVCLAFRSILLWTSDRSPAPSHASDKVIMCFNGLRTATGRQVPYPDSLIVACG